jgi:hypothetical protein
MPVDVELCNQYARAKVTIHEALSRADEGESPERIFAFMREQLAKLDQYHAYLRDQARGNDDRR